MRYILIALMFFNLNLFASIIKTHSAVYSEAMLLKQKVIYLREKANVKSKFPKIEKQKNKAPRHVLQKSLEVLSKINRYREINSYGKIAIPEYPSRDITPSDVYSYVKRLNAEVTLFIDNKKFLSSLKLKRFKNKTQNDVYQLLLSVSLALDPLLGMRGFTPSDVYEQSQTIVAIAKFLRHSQGDFTEVEIPDVKKGLHPNHALNTSYKLLEKIANIEKRLWMKQTDVPKKVYKVTTHTQVYDSLQNIIVEMQRLKTRLGVERYFEVKKVQQDKTPSDVVANLLYAKELLPEFRADKELKQYDKESLKKTPNEVFALTDVILAKLNMIAQHKGINLSIKKPPYIYGLSSRHVYQKGVESIEKATRFKVAEGFFKSNIPTQPFKKVTPDEVYELVDRLDNMVTLILEKNYDKSIKPYKYTLSKNIYYDKTPSDVYNNLWKISNTLDKLLGSEYTPNETFMLAREIEHKVDNILAFLKVKNTHQKIKVSGAKSPRDVFDESLKLYETLKKIKKRANIKTQNIDIPKEKNINPNSVYNALRIIIASINSFNIIYDIEDICIEQQGTITKKTPTDVYKIVKESNKKLLRLFEDDKY
jgi:hypothetical protein